MTRYHLLRFTLACICVLACNTALAAQTVHMPPGYCSAPIMLFADGFESVTPIPHAPSGGSGGAYPGAVTGLFYVPGLGTPGGEQTYYLYVPQNYAPQRALPLMIALHGAAGSHANAMLAAAAVRDNWAPVAEQGGFIVAAPVGNSTHGSWTVSSWIGPTDYDGFAGMLDDIEAAYNIERSRIYLWGFSAGGHVAYDLVFNGAMYATPLHADNLAAFAVSAGVMDGLACDPQSPSGCNQITSSLSRTVPVDIHIGAFDPLLPYAQTDRQRLLAHGWVTGSNLFYTEFSGGHTYTQAHLQSVWDHVCGFARGP